MSVNETKTRLDSEAFKELHHTYHDRLQASVLSCVRNREEAEDITAAAFESAYANRESFRAEAAPTTCNVVCSVMWCVVAVDVGVASRF